MIENLNKLDTEQIVLATEQIVSYALQSGLIKVKNDIAEITWEDIKQLKLGINKTPFSLRVKMEEDGTVTPTVLFNFNNTSINLDHIDSAINNAIQDYESRIKES